MYNIFPANKFGLWSAFVAAVFYTMINKLDVVVTRANYIICWMGNTQQPYDWCHSKLSQWYFLQQNIFPLTENNPLCQYWIGHSSKALCNHDDENLYKSIIFNQKAMCKINTQALQVVLNNWGHWYQGIQRL